MEKKKLGCNICSKKFANKSNLVRHVRTVHKVKIKKNEKKILCGVCKINFNFYKSFEDHLREAHNFTPKIERRLFQSKEEFQIYKKNLEESQASFFSTARKVGSKTYYTCHLSGNSKSSKQTARQQKSGKINATCPARIEIDVKGNWVESFAQLQHFGHSCSVEFLKLRKEDRAAIAAQINRGVSFDKILKTLKSSHNENFSKRINLIKKKDLHNIAREFNIYKGDRYLSDPARLDKWVSRQNFQENNPILFYKKQGEASDVLNEEDFVLVLSTYYLQSTLVSSVKKIVCDSTTGNNNPYQLTTLLTINENETGLPLAYCISNKIDENTMTLFFQVIKESRNEYDAVFMGDDPCYSAWCHVMNPSNERLVTSWHLAKTWKEKLDRLVSNEEKEKVLSHCKKLIDASNTSEFFSHLGGFLNYCSNSKETKFFREYFMKNYAPRLEQWAYSYWSDRGFNTDIYLKSWHRVFKHCYNEGKKCRRVDKCINALMVFTEDVYEWTIPEIKNKSTFRLTEILEYHKQSLEIPPNCIKKVKNNKWLVKGESTDRPNIIQIVDEHCQCDLKCPHCNICVHRVSCTCLSFLISRNICKHVHACINVPYPLEIASPRKSHPEPESIDALEDTVESAIDGSSMESRKEDVVKDLQLICDLIDIIPEEVLEEIHKFTSELLPKVVDLSVIELNQPVVENPKSLTRKTRRIITPTGDNVLIVEEIIDEGMEDANETQLCIHTEFDHVY